MQPETGLAPSYSDASSCSTDTSRKTSRTSRRLGRRNRTPVRLVVKRSIRQSVQRSFSGCANNWTNHGAVHTFAVRDKATGTLLADVNYQLRQQADYSAEVFYWTAAPYRGRGVAQRALRLLCLHARDQAITHLEAHVSVNNPASQTVVTAVGFTPTDRFPDEGNLMIRFVFDPALPTTNP
jgi:RimJ/RimL family protein N-acetyltransferase